MSNPCIKEDAIDTIKEDVREIRKDVKLLIKETAVLRIKSSFWGGFAGIVTSLIAILYGMFK